MTYPTHRGRRLRRGEGLRALARETRIAANPLVAPMFVRDVCTVFDRHLRQKTAQVAPVFSRTV